MTDLPESLAIKPNIPWNKQTLDQLIAERDYWNQKIEAGSPWGASTGCALEFRDACTNEIERRNSK